MTMYRGRDDISDSIPPGEYPFFRDSSNDDLHAGKQAKEISELLNKDDRGTRYNIPRLPIQSQNDSGNQFLDSSNLPDILDLKSMVGVTNNSQRNASNNVYMEMNNNDGEGPFTSNGPMNMNTMKMGNSRPRQPPPSRSPDMSQPMGGNIDMNRLLGELSPANGAPGQMKPSSHAQNFAGSAGLPISALQSSSNSRLPLRNGSNFQEAAQASLLNPVHGPRQDTKLEANPGQAGPKSFQVPPTNAAFMNMQKITHSNAAQNRQGLMAGAPPSAKGGMAPAQVRKDKQALASILAPDRGRPGPPSASMKVPPIRTAEKSASLPSLNKGQIPMMHGKKEKSPVPTMHGKKDKPQFAPSSAKKEKGYIPMPSAKKEEETLGVMPKAENILEEPKMEPKPETENPRKRRLETAPSRDRMMALNSDYSTPFKSDIDVWNRLVAFHVFLTPNVLPETEATWKEKVSKVEKKVDEKFRSILSTMRGSGKGDLYGSILSDTDRILAKRTWNEYWELKRRKEMEEKAKLAREAQMAQMAQMAIKPLGAEPVQQPFDPQQRPGNVHLQNILTTNQPSTSPGELKAPDFNRSGGLAPIASTAQASFHQI